MYDTESITRLFNSLDEAKTKLKPQQLVTIKNLKDLFIRDKTLPFHKIGVLEEIRRCLQFQKDSDLNQLET